MKTIPPLFTGILFLALPYTVRSFPQGTPDERAVTQTLQVSTKGSDSGDGSPAKPFRTLKHALHVALVKKAAGVGVRILLAPGVYREGIPGDRWAITETIREKESTSAPLVIEGQGDAKISGSEDWSGGWQKNPDGTWSKLWPHAFGVPPKSAGVTFGVSDAFLRRELVHVNGRTFYQLNPPHYTNQNGHVGGATEGDPGNPTNVNGGRLTRDEGAFWVTDNDRITIKLPASTPPTFDLNAPGNLVEVSTKQSLFQLRFAGDDGKGKQATAPTNLILRNLTFQHAGGSYAVLLQGINGLKMENCRVVQNKHGGLSVNPGQNVTLRRVSVSENGEFGAGFNHVRDALFEQCQFNRNSRQGEILGYTGWSVCGIKFWTDLGDNYRITMRRCEARDNRATGFWWDTGNVECTMIECEATGNSSNGAFFEDNNSTQNNYERMGTGTVGTMGIPDLGNRPTVTATRCVFAHNRPAPGTESYRLTKGRGIFFSENENAVIENCRIFDNDIQLATYDNVRAENRRFTFRNNIIAAQNKNQRLFAVGSTWDSKETLTAKNSLGVEVATFKGGWYAFFDGISETTNDNHYYAPTANAFPSRDQRWGTDKWIKQPELTDPKLTLEGWRKAHAPRPVDSRSKLTIGSYKDQVKRKA